eukprot:Skav216416  [mRNA]  locus=scaffold457:627719:632279:+ [translate_table: standard]
MAELDAEDVIVAAPEPEEEVTDLNGAVRGVTLGELRGAEEAITSDPWRSGPPPWVHSRPGRSVLLLLKRSLQVDGVVRGLHEVAKHVEIGKAQVVFLADSCNWASHGHHGPRQGSGNEAAYKKLVQGPLTYEMNLLLWQPRGHSLYRVAPAEDKDGLPRKVVGTSCVAVVDFGEEGEAAPAGRDGE